MIWGWRFHAWLDSPWRKRTGLKGLVWSFFLCPRAEKWPPQRLILFICPLCSGIQAHRKNVLKVPYRTTNCQFSKLGMTSQYFHCRKKSIPFLFFLTLSFLIRASREKIWREIESERGVSVTSAPVVTGKRKRESRNTLVWDFTTAVIWTRRDIELERKRARVPRVKIGEN